MKKLVILLVLATLLLSSASIGLAQQAAAAQPAHLPGRAPGQAVQPGPAPDGLGAGGWGSIQAQVAKLTAPDGGAGDLFGVTVSVSGDTAFVGAPGSDVGGNSNQGAAYVFYRDQGGPDYWGLVTKVIVADGVAGDEFGKVSVDGDIAVVSAIHAQFGGHTNQGVAYVFYRNQGGPDAWGQVAKLTSADGAANDEFGWDVAVSGDTAVVSAMNADVVNPNRGAAYVFYRNQGGPDAWGQVAKLIDSDPGYFWQYGWDLSVSGDTAVVGEPGANVGGNAWQGAVLVYERDLGGPDAWGRAAKLTAADGVAGDNLGDGAAVEGDTILAAADYATVGGNAFQGAAYIFYRNQGGPGAWGQVAKLTAADGQAGDYMGEYLSLSGDVAVVPAPWADVGGHEDQGAAYVFYRNQGGPDAWGQAAKLVSADGAAYDEFGTWSAVSGGTALAGAWKADVGGNADQGAAYAFALPALHLNKAKMNGAPAVRPGYFKVVWIGRIRNQEGQAAVGATVYGEFTYPDGSIHPKSGVTDSLGRVKVPIREPQAGTYAFCVTGITQDGYVYDPAANEINPCMSIVVGP